MKVLVVDDLPEVRRATVEMVQYLGHEVIEAKDGKPARKLIEDGLEFDAVISDNNMTELDGVDFLRWFREEHEPLCRTILIIMSGIPSTEIDALVRDHPGIKFLKKPFSDDALKDCLGS